MHDSHQVTVRAPGSMVLLVQVNQECFSHGGWSVEAVAGPISGHQDLQRIQSELDNPPNLPEMLFGSNRLTLTHEASGSQVCSFLCSQRSVGIRPHDHRQAVSAATAATAAAQVH